MTNHACTRDLRPFDSFLYLLIESEHAFGLKSLLMGGLQFLWN